MCLCCSEVSEDIEGVAAGDAEGNVIVLLSDIRVVSGLSETGVGTEHESRNQLGSVQRAYLPMAPIDRRQGGVASFGLVILNRHHLIRPGLDYESECL